MKVFVVTIPHEPGYQAICATEALAQTYVKRQEDDGMDVAFSIDEVDVLEAIA